MEIRVCLLCWIKKVRKEKGKQRFEKTQTNVTITNHRWKSEKHTASNLFTTEVVWSESTAVGIEADGWTEVQAEKTNSICSPMRQRRFQRYRIWTRDTAHNRCPVEESLSLCSFFFCLFVCFFPSPQGRWQDHGSWRVKGQSPRVADTHTHIKTLHQYYKPQCQEHEWINAQNSQCKRMLFRNILTKEDTCARYMYTHAGLLHIVAWLDLIRVCVSEQSVLYITFKFIQNTVNLQVICKWSNWICMS